MTTQQDPSADKEPLKGITVEGWDRVIQVVCAYAYDFMLAEYPYQTPNARQMLWDLILNLVGMESGRKKREATDAADWRHRRERKLRLTHWMVGYIVEQAELRLKDCDVCTLNIDYTGMGTAFFKADVQIDRVQGTPNKFIVTISSNIGFDAKFEDTMLREHQFRAGTLF